jgi:hypothetical protein
LLITKDEWVHADQCNAGEHWLHSVLFVVHPVVLITAGLMWADAAPLNRTRPRASVAKMDFFMRCTPCCCARLRTEDYRLLNSAS